MFRVGNSSANFSSAVDHLIELRRFTLVGRTHVLLRGTPNTLNTKIYRTAHQKECCTVEAYFFEKRKIAEPTACFTCLCRWATQSEGSRSLHKRNSHKANLGHRWPPGHQFNNALLICCLGGTFLLFRNFVQVRKQFQLFRHSIEWRCGAGTHLVHRAATHGLDEKLFAERNGTPKAGLKPCMVVTGFEAMHKGVTRKKRLSILRARFQCALPPELGCGWNVFWEA